MISFAPLQDLKQLPIHVAEDGRFPAINKKIMKHEKVLKDKSAVDKIIVEKQPYQLLNTSREFFPSFMPRTFINLTLNRRKLGPASSLFCTLYECAKVR